MPFNNKAKFSLIVSIFSVKTSKTRLRIPVIHLTKIKAYLSKIIQFSCCHEHCNGTWKRNKHAGAISLRNV